MADALAGGTQLSPPSLDPTKNPTRTPHEWSSSRRKRQHSALTGPTHAAAAPLTGGLSPVSLGLALADWAWHLALSPGRQLELAALARN
ncbi:MAG: poly-beta-hydroxybutyrate polymerase N-terminal domain-containing protein [Rhodoferax sp.]|nr:poly-beta-hydroxybutyrate polymerase N-terminal domain-containing protein [Rhodoferax sp.]